VRGRKARARRLDKLDKLEVSFESTKVTFTDCLTHLAYEDLNSKDVDELRYQMDG